MGGGAIIPQHPSPSIAAKMQSETEPRWLGCGILAQSHPHLVFRGHTTPPAPLAPPPLPPHMHHCHTLTHRPPSPFHMVCPKPSHNGLVSYFWLKPHPPPCISQTHHPTTTTTTLYAPPTHPYTPFSITVSHSAPETEPQWLSFMFLAQPCVSRTRHPTTTTLYAPPSHPYAAFSITVSHGMP
jgi:hypothetical protein